MSMLIYRRRSFCRITSGNPVIPLLVLIACCAVGIVALGDRNYGAALALVGAGVASGLIATRRIWFAIRTLFPLFPRS